MVKHLPEFGWQPSVLTVKEDSFSDADESLVNEVDESIDVIRTDFWDPFEYYKKFLGKDPNKPLVASEALTKTEVSWKHKLTVWIRMNLFVPDARIGWYLPGVKKAKEYIRNNKVDAIVTNGPPHTTHLLGKALSKKFGIPLVAVFIDPWVDIAYYKGQRRNPVVLKYDNHLEKSVLEKSSEVVFVTEGMKEYFEDKYPFVKEKSNLLYWGYNEESFEGINKIDNGDYEVLLHAGNIFDYQNPKKFWKTVKHQINNGRKLKLRFVGTVSPGIKNEIKLNGLEEYTEYLGFLPYNEMLAQVFSADYLFVCATEPRHVPGKLFEYMRSGNPIIAFGDDNNEVAEILSETNTGMLFRYDESGEKFFDNVSGIKPDLSAVKQFDRKVIAEKLSSILDTL